MGSIVVTSRSRATVLLGCLWLTACAGEVVATPPPPAEPCPELRAARLSSSEFLDVIACRYGEAAGWRIVALGGSPKSDMPQLGYGSRWRVHLLNVESGEAVTVGFKSTEATLVEEPVEGHSLASCMSAESGVELADSVMLMQHVTMEHPIDAIEAWVSLRATLPCVEGGTCGNTVISVQQIVYPFSMVYSPNGTLLLDTKGADATGCEDF